MIILEQFGFRVFTIKFFSFIFSPEVTIGVHCVGSTAADARPRLDTNSQSTLVKSCWNRSHHSAHNCCWSCSPGRQEKSEKVVARKANEEQTYATYTRPAIKIVYKKLKNKRNDIHRSNYFLHTLSLTHIWCCCRVDRNLSPSWFFAQMTVRLASDAFKIWWNL